MFADDLRGNFVIYPKSVVTYLNNVFHQIHLSQAEKIVRWFSLKIQQNNKIHARNVILLHLKLFVYEKWSNMKNKSSHVLLQKFIIFWNCATSKETASVVL